MSKLNIIKEIKHNNYSSIVIERLNAFNYNVYLKNYNFKHNSKKHSNYNEALDDFNKRIIEFKNDHRLDKLKMKFGELA